MDGSTVIDDDVPRVQTGYQLVGSDPRRVGQVALLRRMRDSFAALESDDKPFPFLGRALPGLAAVQESLLLVKVGRKPVSDLGQRCLDEEEDWARATGRFHSSGQDKKYVWMAREYIQGVALHRLPTDASEDQLRLYAHWLLREIHDWHTLHGESHLDIKPSNVVVTDERAILIDFETSVDHGSVDNAHALATAAFASPEQVFRHDEHEIATPSDVFSWGLTVSSLFRRDFHPYCDGPFDLGRFALVNDRVSAGEGAPQPDLSAVGSIGLREAAGRSLAWHPEDRPTSGELIEMLNRTEPMLVFRRLAVADLKTPPPDVGSTPRSVIEHLRWWVGPAGPMGARDMDGFVQLVGLSVVVMAGLLVGLGLGLLGGVMLR